MAVREEPAGGNASWLGIGDDDPFGLQNLPYGSFTTASDDRPRVGIAVGDQVLDLTAASMHVLPHEVALFASGTLDPLLAAGPRTWRTVRQALAAAFVSEHHRGALERLLVPAADAVLRLPFTVADYIDFYASEHHASNLGRILRPGQEPLTPNWKHLPIGYHGRAGTVVVSGTPVVRPSGQRRAPDGGIVVGPTQRLDIEAEMGFVVGAPSRLGQAVPLAAFAQHVFGVCIVNDWSARDIQAWEYVPLGPFLGKSFATSISPWVVPLDALQQARVPPPHRDPQPAAYLDDTRAEPWGLDIRLRVEINGHVVSRPPFATMYWTPAQMVAHMTLNGASLRTGDLFASGTVSGAAPGDRGSLIELTRNGAEPLMLPDGSTRGFLEDGDEVSISATAACQGSGVQVGLGEVRGRIRPWPGEPTGHSSAGS